MKIIETPVYLYAELSGAAETGVSETTLSRMSSGRRVCDAASMAALSAWAGINPARFSDWVPPRPAVNETIANVKLKGRR